MGTTGDHQAPLFPHKIDEWSPWSPVVPNNGDRGPRVSPPKGGPRGSTPGPVTRTFTANTCLKCGSITIAGISEDTGCRLDLEPSPLTDLDEYRAIVDQVRTYNLGDDLAAMRRFVTEVRSPTRVDRHALHTCGKTYGHGSSTRTRTRTPVQPDEPPF